ncbi:hypothetical protein COCNU_03G010760 [Cocos nucifera]|uniref:Sodium/calcium exchanger membrane region domain-containing protein n=1 Tax=Cocos nucifera TaxID=13894 RepID=A0A8K0I360_COCNU|nr:hypothetical protein COCNU_03G010760 [Cocos nucifera]
MASMEEATRRLEDGAQGKEAPVLPPRRTGHGMSSSSLLRRRSDRSVLSKVGSEPLRLLLANLQEVFLGTKLSPLFPAVALAIAAECFDFGRDEADGDDDAVSDTPVIGFASAFAWLVGMTAVVAVLSDYVVTTIEAASESWGMSVSFVSVILLPFVGNAAEHAAAIIFAFKNKIDITLGITLGSSTQISMFVVPLSVIVAWIKGIHMDLGFELLETGSLVMSILVTAFTLQDGTWHYMKGFVLLLCYVVIGASFFILRPSLDQANGINWGVKTIPMKSVKA